MTTTRSIPPTERTLPPLLSAQERTAKLCHDCGAMGTTLWRNKTVLLCGRCAVRRYEEMRGC